MRAALKAIEAEADKLRAERDAARAEAKGQKYIDYHVVTKDGDVVSDVLRFLPDAEKACARCDEDYPDEVPHRIQSRIVIYADWADHEA